MPLNRSTVASVELAMWIGQERCITRHILTEHSSRRAVTPSTTHHGESTAREATPWGRAKEAQLPLLSPPLSRLWFLCSAKLSFQPPAAFDNPRETKTASAFATSEMDRPLMMSMRDAGECEVHTGCGRFEFTSEVSA
ncbi:hypothetical protein DPEC_G00176250 [Dallia pectoralis]|uniref:Uncharacterized protein n=1 Tax=Dallia pectoralis TaxID=75939 RepID=A0ACC2GET7_DALPE|nr:hypothetical protein DPEC_G00176250 [Dallia pectoralis]